MTSDRDHEGPERCDICRRRGPSVEDRERPGLLCSRCARMSQAITTVPLYSDVKTAAMRATPSSPLRCDACRRPRRKPRGS